MILPGKEQKNGQVLSKNSGLSSAIQIAGATVSLRVIDGNQFGCSSKTIQSIGVKTPI